MPVLPHAHGTAVPPRGRSHPSLIIIIIIIIITIIHFIFITVAFTRTQLLAFTGSAPSLVAARAYIIIIIIILNRGSDNMPTAGRQTLSLSALLFSLSLSRSISPPNATTCSRVAAVPEDPSAPSHTWKVRPTDTLWVPGWKSQIHGRYQMDLLALRMHPPSVSGHLAGKQSVCMRLYSF